MRAFLNEQYRNEEICPGRNWREVYHGKYDVRSFRLVQGHFQYNFRELVSEQARTMVVLRDPIRRTISTLSHLRRDPHFHPMHSLVKDLTLGEMIRTPAVIGMLRDVQARFLCASLSPTQVHAWLSRGADAAEFEDPPTLDLAVSRLKNIEFVGTTENIAPLIQELASEMDYHPARSIPIINDNPDKADPIAELSHEELEIIREHTRVDSALYEYALKQLEWRHCRRAIRRLVGRGIYRRQPGSFGLDIANIIPGTGWYDPEGDEFGRRRWTGPDRIVTLALPLRDDRSYLMSLRFNDQRPGGPRPLAVEVNGEPATSSVSAEDDYLRLDISISSTELKAAGGICQIRIDTGETIPLSKSDSRRLGIVVRDISFLSRKD